MWDVEKIKYNKIFRKTNALHCTGQADSKMTLLGYPQTAGKH